MVFIRSVFVGFLFVCLTIQSTSATSVRIKLFADGPLKKVLFGTKTGGYQVFANGQQIYEVSNEDVLQMTLVGTKVELKNLTRVIGTFDSVEIKEKLPDLFFSIKCVDPSHALSRWYNGNLTVKMGVDSAMLLINTVDLEDYIAAVVESEGGYSKYHEFYKVHAVLVRTYTLKHLYKHLPDGCNLCDQVHCQVLKSRCVNPDILEAVKSTEGQVILDENNELIISAYHSNSGGMTCNSEDVWANKTTYMRSVKDTFALAMKNAYWEQKITKQDWVEYLVKRCNLPESTITAEYAAFHFSQPTRKVNYEVANVKIPLKEIRENFKLRSAFFSFAPVDDYTLLFKGKGYGHGVGLCQEGAKRMAQLGYSYKKIVHFYFQHVKIVKMDDYSTILD